MDIRIIDTPITRAIAKDLAETCYGDMVKGVVDVERGVIALGGEWHIDANRVLIENGSRQDALWGFNFYPGEDRIACVSLINIRPALNNRAMRIEDEALRQKMEAIIRALIV